MRSTKLIIAFILTCLLFSGCEKLPMDDCFKSTGEITLEHRTIEPFEYISLEDNINLIITQGETESVTVRAGENLLSDIVTEVDNNQLTIRNDNNCNWVRNYNKDIDVYLTVRYLTGITYRSSGLVLSTNTIISDSLSIAVWDGTGTIDMDIQTRVSTLSIHYGSVDFHIRGQSGVTFIYAGSYGPFFCQELISQFTFMNNRGSNDCYVHCNKQLEVEIEYTGSIYYTGRPEIVKAKITGSGQLINLDD